MSDDAPNAHNFAPDDEMGSANDGCLEWPKRSSQGEALVVLMRIAMEWRRLHESTGDDAAEEYIIAQEMRNAVPLHWLCALLDWANDVVEN